MASRILRSLRGSNLEILKFGMYLAFPIGWMYYFGTNLDSRFSVPDFWPTQEQSHKIPTEKADIAKEIQRIQMEMKEKSERRNRLQLEEMKNAFREGKVGEGGEGG